MQPFVYFRGPVDKFVQVCPCSICSRNVGNNSLQCGNCQLWEHQKCSNLSKADIGKIDLVLF